MYTLLWHVLLVYTLLWQTCVRDIGKAELSKLRKETSLSELMTQG